MIPRNQILQGDVLDRLRELPDGCCQVCVTSPPFFGLRDYQTGTWEGGDPGCGHKIPASTLGGGDNKSHSGSFAQNYKNICGKCGARRVDWQIGLEKTVLEYVVKMVRVFREVRRILRDDGTCWINLGSSYASGGTHPTLSPLLKRVLACDSDGTGQPGLKGPGPAYPYSDGGHQDDSQIHPHHISHICQEPPEDALTLSQKDHDSEHLDSFEVPPGASLLDAQESTIPGSSSPPSGASSLSATASAFQKESPTFFSADLQSYDNSACISGTSQRLPPLTVHILGKESFFSACQSPDCLGIGRCGLCWCNLSIPSLNVKQKDLINIPSLIALSLQADGWYIRSDIAWCKKSAMPESVQDRPTTAWEHIWLMSKNRKYYYDAFAVRQPYKVESIGRYKYRLDGTAPTKRQPGGDVDRAKRESHVREPNPFGANLRNFWLLGPEPFPLAHFATFPTEIPRRAIRAGSSERGACPECGSPWTRVVRSEKSFQSGSGRSGNPIAGKQNLSAPATNSTPDVRKGPVLTSSTTGWSPSCSCGRTDTIPCVVLDPFCGSGTTCVVAQQEGRDYIGIELNLDYVEMAKRRIRDEAGQRRLI